MTERITLPKIEDRIIELSEKLESLMTQHGEIVWETALTVTRINSAGTLLVGGSCLLVSYFLWRLWGRPTYLAFTDKACDEEAWVFGIGGFIAFVFATMTLVIGIIQLFKLWAWVGLFSPQLVIAAKMLDKAL